MRDINGFKVRHQRLEAQKITVVRALVARREGARALIGILSVQADFLRGYTMSKVDDPHIDIPGGRRIPVVDH